MDNVFKELLSRLPKEDISPRELSKVKRILPIPSEHEVLWIHVVSKGGHPAAYAITDRAFIYKASRSDVSDLNKKIKAGNKGKPKKEKRSKLKFIYQIIPWEYYSPELIQLSCDKSADGKETATFSFDGERIVSLNDRTLYDFFQEYNAKILIQRQLVSSATVSDLNSFAVDNIYYNQDLGVANTKTGHGIYAEDVNNHIDRVKGRKAKVVGRDNARNGPDRIVNGQQIQTKYCASAKSSVDACFDKNTGDFRYQRIDNGKPMMVEVPSDQYAEAVEHFAEKIKQGKVPGVTDPKQANHIIRKGNLTYKQARNLAKAGTVESLKFDARTNAVHCLSALGVSAVASFAFTFWRTKSFEAAAENAVMTGVQVFGTSFTGSVLASQAAKSSVPLFVRPLFSLISKAIGPKGTQGIINIFRNLAGKKPTYGAAAQKQFVNFLSTKFVTTSVMFVVFSIPDTYRVITGKVSGAQYVKNLFSLAASFAGAAFGSAVGAKIGASAGKFAGPIGFVGGLAGGAIAGGLARFIGNVFREDDAVIYGRMINEYVSLLAIDYMMTDDEQDKYIALLNKDEKGIKKLIQKLVKSKNQEKDIIDFLQPKIKKATSSREKLCLEQESIVTNGLNIYNGGYGIA